jgi:sugar/nucleoside kinase (ribokinase family)
MTQYDVCGVGNAIVDVLFKSDDDFLKKFDLPKGGMVLVDLAQSDNLFSNAGIIAQQQSGGSGANTIAGIASFGGTCAFIGKVADDDMGKVFRHDMKAMGIAFDTHTGQMYPTARCMIFVTPDAERTMATYLGISTNITKDDLESEKIHNAKVTYLEGYLFDKPKAKEAFKAATAMAHTAARKVALTLSDVFCVERHRDDFKNLVDHHVDILFANERELTALYQTTDFESALAMLPKDKICAVTRGAKGAIVLWNGERADIAATPVAKVVDTTGAGDMFAAGFLYGLTQGKDAATCGLLGARAAAQIIQQFGARPQTALKGLLAA